MKVLFGALGRSPGSLFTAIVSERPDVVRVITSAEVSASLAELEREARKHHPAFTVEATSVADGLTSFDEGRRWAQACAAAAAPGDEAVVNLAGGSTALQDALWCVARLLEARTVAAVDRRAPRDQQESPYVVGALVEVPPWEPVVATPSGSTFDALQGVTQVLMASGQTLPSILAMKELGTRECVIFCTPEEKPRRLMRACEASGIRVLEAPIEIPGYDAREVERRARQVRDRWAREGRRLVLNYTAGTKQMAFGLLRGLGNGDLPGPVVGAVYTDRGRTLYAHHAGRDEHREFRCRLGVTELLAAHGILPWSRGGGFLEREQVSRPDQPVDPADAALAGRIAADVDGFDARWSAVRKRGQHRIRVEAERALAPYGAPSTVVAEGLANGTWLELYVWGVLQSARAELAVDDVRWSVMIQRIDAAGHPSPVTDLDVCFTSRNNLYFVSCKTEAPEGLGDEILAVAKRQNEFGGTFGRGMLLHWHPESVQKVPGLVAAADVLRIPVVGREGIKNPKRLVDALRTMIR